jgi:RNA polymerase sigma factor (sigma-70 family)
LSSKLSNDKERQLFEEFFVEGKTVIEIARERQVSRQAVDKQLSRVIRKLRPYVS